MVLLLLNYTLQTLLSPDHVRHQPGWLNRGNLATSGVVRYRNNSHPVNDLPASICGFSACIAHLRQDLATSLNGINSGPRPVLSRSTAARRVKNPCRATP